MVHLGGEPPLTTDSSNVTTPRALLLVHLAVAALTAPAAFAQSGSISGTIVNAATREPIEGAMVSVHGTPYMSFSRANGAFTILGVPPGAYAVSARRVGFATREFTGVNVLTGRTRALSFALRASASDTTDRSEAEPVFVDPNIGGTTVSLSRDQITSLPVLSMSGALGINGGYVDLPRSTATLSLADLRRGVTSLPSVRAGRSDATQYLLDGIAVNNPVFGSPPLFIEPFGAASVTFSPAHVDAEHGAALSGLVNQAIRGGGARLNGAAEYQTTALAGALGSDASRASGTYAARGFLAGPLPFAGDAFRFSLAGHLLGERANVRQLVNRQWHGSGATQNDQMVAKVSYAVRPTVTLSVAMVGQRRGTVGVDPDFIEGDSVAPATVRDNSRFIVARAEKRFARANVSLSLADNREHRETCNIWQGVCVEDRFMRNPAGSEIPGFGPPPRQTPYAVSGQFFGGESYRTQVLRADVVAQASDHHQVAAGVYASRHDIAYRDAIGYRWLQGTILTVTDAYRASPTEFASYVQDALEFDLITIHIGARFDYGNTGGVAFTNPLNPTNGTTAREVCEGTAASINDVPFTYGAFRGIAACANAPSGVSGRSVLLDSATRLAQRDDFRDVRPRAAFAPRLGLSFPLTERSGLFFNIGRYSRNPAYHDAFRNSGTGSRAGTGADGMCISERARPGTNECVPDIVFDPTIPEFVGNPDLSFELADAWEAGFTSWVGREHSLDASVFSNTQSHLPSVYTSTLTPDIGLTYGPISQHPFRIVQSGGSISSLGASVTVRRNAAGPLSYTINYTYQRSTEIGASPDLVAEALASNEIFNNTAERYSARNHPHTVNAQFAWQWRNDSPRTLGRVSAAVLRNSRTVVTYSAASASKPATLSEVTCSPTLGQPCAAIGGGVSGTGRLVNLMYVRTLASPGARWDLIARVLNVLDEDDGSANLLNLRARRSGAGAGRTALPSTQRVSFRRVLVGMGVNF